MKHIYRLLASALVLFTAAACYNQEIEGPQNPQYSDLKITARILKTRVSSDSETDGFLSLKWTQGDILFGFYDDDKSNTIILRVKSVDPANGDADLEIVYVSHYNELVDQNTHVNLIYKGDNVPMGDIDPSSYKFDSNMEFPVSLSDQDLSILPICMSADDVIDGNSFTFDFAYDCALLEIESLTGFKEQSKPSGELSKLEVTKVPSCGKYSIIEDESGKCQLKFTSTDDELKGYSFNLTNSGWSINTDGEIVNSSDSDKKFLLAVVPNSDMDAEDLENIDVKVYVGGNPSYSLPCGVHTIFGGVCYVINAQPVVARTIDGKCHSTVAGAFGWAETEIKGNSIYSGRENVVTLIKEHIDEGLGIPLPENPILVPRDPEDEEDYDSYYWDKPLNVNSEITLDLNGCTLSIPYDEQYVEVDDDDWSVKEYFYVTSTGKLTVKDSRTGGMLESDSNKHIIVNDGTVNIENGIISHNRDWSAVDNSNKLTIYGGSLSAVDWHTIQNCGELKILGGTVFSDGYNAIFSVCPDDTSIPSVIIGDGESNKPINISSSGGIAIYVSDYIDEESDIHNTNGAYFEMNQGIVSADSDFAVYVKGYAFSPSAVRLNGEVIGKITGGTVEGTDIALEVLFGADCTISGGKIKSTGGSGPAVLCFTATADDGTKLTVRWPDGYKETDTLYEPFISSSSTNSSQWFFTPLCFYMDHVNNYATAIISGGYLYSYQDSFFCSSPNCLDDNASGGFYSNISLIYTLGSDSKGKFDLYEGGDKNITHLMAEKDETRIIPDPFEDGEELAFPYKIVKKPSNGPTGNTDKYTFTPYGW